MVKFQSPAAFEPGINPGDTWRKWLQKLRTLLATDLEKKPVAGQRGSLFHGLRDEGLELYNTLTFTERGEELNNSSNFGQVRWLLQRLSQHRPNLRKVGVLGCSNSGTRDSRCVTDLKQLTVTLKILKDSLIRDQIVRGITDSILCQRPLRESKLTLAEAIIACRTAESARMRNEKMAARGSSEVTTNAIATNRSQQGEKKEINGNKRRRKMR